MELTEANNTKQCIRCDNWRYLHQYARAKNARGRIVTSGICNKCKDEEIRPSDFVQEVKSTSEEVLINRSKDSHILNGKTKENITFRGYNLSKEEFTQMYLEQEGKCEICGKLEEDNNRALAIDHCHITGMVRGLLCGKCNTGIGMLNDNAELVKSALLYLRKTQPQKIKEKTIEEIENIVRK